ncbi:MAG: acyl-CoA synthetase [Actinobacteria bacterium]|nr:acyl-CoA synthetase [Actinomycetota bacterium]
MAFNLADLFELVVDTVPDRLALVAGGRRLTYRELDERSNRFAHHLAAAGIGAGAPVAIYSWNRAEWIEAMFAAWKIRAVPINLNYRYVADEARYILDNADVVAVVHERGFAPVLQSIAADLPRVRHYVTLDDGTVDEDARRACDALAGVDYEDALRAQSPARGFAPRSSDDLYMLYTGGTTGMPKGVVWRHEDIFFAAMGGGGFGQPPIATPEELRTRVAAEGTQLVGICNAPMMHGGGQWVSCIAFFGGNTCILNTSRHFDADEVLRLAERERARTIMVVGDAMARPLADALSNPAASYDTSNIVGIGSGGALLSAAVKEQLRAVLPNAVVVDSFGASETGAGGSVMDVDGPAAGPRFTMGPFMTVLDDELRPVEPGSGRVGRLARGGHVPLRYHKDEDKTAATFLTTADGTRWVVPGDHARIEADGAITLLGRGSVCINSGGEKIFPEEVEAALKAHPDVFDAVVIGVPDERFVERVAAIVQPRPGGSVSLEAVQEHCRTKLAGYKVPRQLVVLDELVRTPVGKPDYRWAKATALAASPALSPPRSRSPASGTA